MAEEPKKVRKRAVKKSASKAVEQSESAPIAKEKKSKAGVIPAPIFQAAPVAAAPKAKPATTKPATTKPAPKSAAEVPGESEAERENRRRRRRRGGRSRRRLEKDESPTTSPAVGKEPSSDSEGSVGFKKRRRRRRSGADGVAPGEKIEEDGVLTVVKVREPRPVQEKPVREKKSFDRPPRRFKDRDRDRGREKPRYNDYRENRRRGTILTDAEFLARRESVDREMLVRQQGDRTQIAILEDKVLVEHYVNRNSNQSYVGNVYLGRVQNVLPSMEAAFVDIGKGRNAVLYAGEVNWDAAGISE